MKLKPVDQLIQRADSILLGTSGTLEDWRDALQIYLQAGGMGAGLGFSKVGSMYFSGQDVKKNLEKSVEYFKKAVSLGCFENYSLLIESYIQLKEIKPAVNALRYYLDSQVKYDLPAHERLRIYRTFFKYDYYLGTEFFAEIIKEVRLLIYVNESCLLESNLNSKYSEDRLFYRELWDDIIRLGSDIQMKVEPYSSIIQEAIDDDNTEKTDSEIRNYFAKESENYAGIVYNRNSRFPTDAAKEAELKKFF